MEREFLIVGWHSHINKSDLGTKINCLMQSLLLSKVVLDKIDKINKDFFWKKHKSANYCSLIIYLAKI